MHQQSRAPPRGPSPASSPQTNPMRTNNPREAATAGTAAGAADTRQRAGSSLASKEALGSPTMESSASASGLPAESVKKLDQIIQNFFIKSAFLVLDSRIKVTHTRLAGGAKKMNRWFQLETAEIDDCKEELKTWKISGSLVNRPPTMAIEVYLDTSSLKDSQSLVIIDEDGKRWDVMEQLNSSESSSTGSSSAGIGKRSTEVILERWEFQLKVAANQPTEDFGAILPTIYKKAIVFFRSLFSSTRLFPAWKFASQGVARGSHLALTPQCRVRAYTPEQRRPDPLRYPIDGRRDPVTEYMFGDLEVPVGRLSTSVTYRNDCTFRIDDSESLLSSRFMGADENFFKPSLPRREDQVPDHAAEVGSLRDHRRQRKNQRELHQTYGSLSTFHGDGPLGTSPLSALKAVRPPGSDTDSPPPSLPSTAPQEPPSSLPISGRDATSRPTLRSSDGSGRRTSISFQPFKAGSLSASPVPRQIEAESPASPQSLTRPAAPPALNQPRTRTSLTAGMPASLRGGPNPANTGEATVVGSPRPGSTSRYSSSFTHRRARLSFGGTSRAGDDEQGSSGRQSLASSVAQPGSGLLAETGGTSSGSLHDEDNISEFLKALDSKKTLKSFEPTSRGDSSTNRTVAQLNKFHQMKETNNALTESMTSEMHRSSSSSSRQLTSVPSMVAPASMSASSSPGKPLSPHTPHTPAVPSRLSANFVANNSSGQGRPSSRQRQASGSEDTPAPSRQNTLTQEGTNAIDIPLSPRLVSYQRRPSSAAMHRRTGGEVDEPDLAFAQRSLSLGADDREAPKRATLRERPVQLEEESTVREGSSSGLQPAADVRAMSTSASASVSASGGMRQGSTEDTPPDAFISSPFGRRRYTGLPAGSRRGPRSQSSRGSFTGSVSRLGGRGEDEGMGTEPEIFDVEMDAQARRSIEESRGGGQNSASERGGSESRGAPRKVW